MKPNSSKQPVNIKYSNNTNITNKNDIHDRIYRYVLRVLSFSKHIPLNLQNSPIINQLVRSSSSIGANDQEADGILTKKDFIKTYVIVRKEAKETVYWLKLLRDLNSSLSPRMTEIINEGEEILKIVSAIINKTIENDK